MKVIKINFKFKNWFFLAFGNESRGVGPYFYECPMALEGRSLARVHQIKKSRRISVVTYIKI